MNKNTFFLLAKYNEMVNEKLIDILKSMSDEEWNRQLAGYFKSLRELCSHIYIADYNWIKRIKPAKDFNALKDGYFDSEYTYRDTLFPSREEYFTWRKKLDDKITAIIRETGDDDYSIMVKYTNSKGIISEKSLGIALMQVFVHQTHTRGMISHYLEMLGKENDFCLILPLDGLSAG